MKPHTSDEPRSLKRVERVTVSLPRALYERGEELRARRNLNRSEFIAELYERYLEHIDRQERLARYAVAYAQVPETAGERALTEISMELLASESS